MTALRKKPLVKCKCPNCREIHYSRFLWTGGNYIPRKFCNNCKSLLKNETADVMAEHKVLYASTNKIKRE